MEGGTKYSAETWEITIDAQRQTRQQHEDVSSQMELRKWQAG